LPNMATQLSIESRETGQSQDYQNGKMSSSRMPSHLFNNTATQRVKTPQIQL
jgi:hypothetical protein